MSHLLDVGTSFPNDVFVELLEDWDRDGEAVLNLWRERLRKDMRNQNMVQCPYEAKGVRQGPAGSGGDVRGQQGVSAGTCHTSPPHSWDPAAARCHSSGTGQGN